MTAQERASLFELITQDERICFGIGIMDSQTVDKLNIFQATVAAMLMAISKLVQLPEMLLVDGMKLPHPTIPTQKLSMEMLNLNQLQLHLFLQKKPEIV